MPNFTVMTWNVENLFRPEDDAATEEQERYELKLSLIAGLINLRGPDVVALQEVGGVGPLQDLQQALDGTYPHRIISLFPDSRGIRVAFLSALPLDEPSEDIVDFPSGPALDVNDLTATGGSEPITRMSRGALRIRVTKDGLTLDVITAHLKSKLLTFPRPGGSSFTPRNEGERAQAAGVALLKREAEAVTLRLRINSFLEGNGHLPLLLLGDFNDVPEAQTSLILNGPPGSEIGTPGFNRPDVGDDARLFNLAPIIPEARRFSRKHHGRGELIDQIFASEEMLPFEQNNHRRLPDVDSLIDFAGELPSIGDNPDARAQAVMPDHAPVIASFDL
jgi:endonuclease/exonuclease/phosphatase family metal-dependent hydrolase